MPLGPAPAEAAVAAIQTAFAGLVPPGDGALLHPRCLDDGDIAEFYGAPHVVDLDGEFLIRNYAAPSFFSAAAFRYYMPAYMLWALRHPDTIEYVVEATLRAFDPGRPGDRFRDFQVSKFVLFDEPQRAAVTRFLEAFVPHADLGDIAEGALENYWIRDAPPVA